MRIIRIVILLLLKNDENVPKIVEIELKSPKIADLGLKQCWIYGGVGGCAPPKVFGFL